MEIEKKMLRFKEFIEEMYIKPKSNTEEKEIPFQIDSSPHEHVNNQLRHLSNPINFKNALANSKIENYDVDKMKKVDNTDAADKGSFKSLNPTKQKRVSNIFNKGRSIETPIILRHKDSGHEHLLSGNTRATYGIQNRGKIKASVIEY